VDLIGVQVGLRVLFELGLVLVMLGAFVDAAIRPTRYWQAADINRAGWLSVLGVTPLVLFSNPLGLGSTAALVGLVAVIVYFVDRRPKLKALKGGGGSGGGPYGGW
jgi:hypothetical protein